MPDMLHIPEELIVMILGQLSFRDIVVSTQVCKRWKRIVDESLPLQYRIELGVSGRVALDREYSLAPEELPFKTRMDELSTFCELWKRERIVLKTDHRYKPSSASHKTVTSGCLICRARSENTRGVINCVRQNHDLKLQNWTWLTPHLGDYSEQAVSLFAGLFIGARADNNNTEGAEVVIDILSLETGNNHAEAERQPIRLPSCDRDGTTFINQICIHGDLFAIRLSSTYGSSFIRNIKIFNWKTGDPVSDILHSSPYYEKNKGVVFLSKNAILTNSMRKYDSFLDATIEMYSAEKTGRHLATFHLPKLSRVGRTAVDLLYSSSESDNVQCARLTTTNLSNARLLGITVRGTERIHEEYQHVCTFVTPLSVFQNHKSLFCRLDATLDDSEKSVVTVDENGVVDIPWDVWGPKFTRLLPGLCTSTATYGWKISMAHGIFDFNQVDIARDLQRFGAAYWQHRDRSVITTESTPFQHSKFLHQVTTSLPYRFIKLDIPDDYSVILGEGIIYRCLPPFEEIRFLSEDKNGTLHTTSLDPGMTS